MNLTPKQRRALEVFNREGELDEDMLANEWPLIRRPRLVANGLVAKGLVRFGRYWGEEAGYELLLTPLGVRTAAALTSVEGVSTDGD